MKKFRTVLALAVIAPMLAACAPSPDDVCQHVIDMMKKELGDAADSMGEDEMKEMKEKCVKDAEKEKELKGAMEYKKQAKCIMDASNLEQLAKCDSKDEDKK